MKKSSNNSGKSPKLIQLLTTAGLCTLLAACGKNLLSNEPVVPNSQNQTPIEREDGNASDNKSGQPKSGDATLPQNNVSGNGSNYYQEPVLSDQRIAALIELWGDKRSKSKEPIWFAAFLKQKARIIAHSKLLRRVANTGKGIYHAFNFGDPNHWRKSGLALSDSPINVLGTLNDTVSDLVTLGVRSNFYIQSPVSQRIQVCTANVQSPISKKFTFYHPINPGIHIGVLIDGYEYFADPGIHNPDVSGLKAALDLEEPVSCSQVPFKSQEPEPILIEKLRCIAPQYREETQYQLLKYNCGSYVRDILKSSGLGYLDFPNLGIGEEIPLGFNVTQSLRDKQKRAKKLQSITESCEQHITELRDIFVNLELGSELSESSWRYLNSYPLFHLSSDALIQLIAGAARGQNPQNRDVLAQLRDKWELKVPNQVYLNQNGVPRNPRMQRILKALLVQLDEEAQHWMITTYPETEELIRAVQPNISN